MTARRACAGCCRVRRASSGAYALAAAALARPPARARARAYGGRGATPLRPSRRAALDPAARFPLSPSAGQADVTVPAPWILTTCSGAVGAGDGGQQQHGQQRQQEQQQEQEGSGEPAKGRRQRRPPGAPGGWLVQRPRAEGADALVWSVPAGSLAHWPLVSLATTAAGAACCAAVVRAALAAARGLAVARQKAD